jgi:sugar lactone lactonase YvrE
MKTNLPSHFKFTLIALMLVLAVSAVGLIPQSAYADPGDLYVSDTFSNTIYVVGSDGTLKRTFLVPTSDPAGGQNIGVAFDAIGNLFVSHFDNVGVTGSIIKITPAGAQSTFADGLQIPIGLAFDTAGNLLVVDNAFAVDGAGTILKFTPPFTDSDNVPSTFAGPLTSPPSGLTSPRGVVFDSAGNLYVSQDGCNCDTTPDIVGSGSILTWPHDSPNGTTGTPFVTSLTLPRGMVFDSAGYLYVAEKRTSATSFPNRSGDILKFTPTGTLITPRFAPAPDQTPLLGQPIGIALDGASNVFVAEASFPDILKFTPDGVQSILAGAAIFPDTASLVWLAFEPNTTMGTNINVPIGPVGSGNTNISLTFPLVTSAGTTTVTPDPSPSPLPSQFELAGSNLAFQITTTATYTTPPPITIAFQVSVDPTIFSLLRILHYEGGSWVDVTATDPAPDPTTQTIYASVSSLSPFVIAKLKFRAQVQQPINADGSSVFSVRRGVVPMKFTLTQDGNATCALPAATIALTRTSGGTTGAIDEAIYTMSADTGSNFRIDSCQYIYNLSSSALGVGTYRIDIMIDGQVVGSGSFQLK